VVLVSLTSRTVDGPATLRLAEAGFEVVGVDITEGLLEYAKKSVAQLKDAHLELADVRQWQPPDDRLGKVDCIVTFYLFNHFPLTDWKAMVAKMVTWLSPGGIIVFANLSDTHGWIKPRHRWVPSTSLSIEENTALFGAHDCVVAKAWEEFSRQGPTRRKHQFLCIRKK
jgi:cyclopropane fatty-acyl-phospholipid synthase-like methyltransferase